MQVLVAWAAASTPSTEAKGHSQHVSKSRRKVDFLNAFSLTLYVLLVLIYFNGQDCHETFLAPLKISPLRRQGVIQARRDGIKDYQPVCTPGSK
eukprot:423818-Amphidinium_carterae.1